jgi:Beta-1,3-glucanase
VAQLPAAQQSNPANFYLAALANYYAQFWHQNAINGLQYGFPYDDDARQSSDISITNPQYLVAALAARQQGPARTVGPPTQSYRRVFTAPLLTGRQRGKDFMHGGAVPGVFGLRGG